MNSPYARLCQYARETATLGGVSSLLGWDQETYMPPGAAAHRADQLAMLAGLVHERRTSAEFGDLLSACEADRDLTADHAGEVAANLREFRRDRDLATKLPTVLVGEIAGATSRAQEVWKSAKGSNDFGLFAPELERVLGLMRRKAECYGVPPGGELYDALLNEYEPGATAREIEAVFTPLRPRLAGLVADLTGSARARAAPAPGVARVLETRMPQAQQHAFALDVLKAIGFDLHTGRLDTTAHPFCQEMGPGDTRLTTRYTSVCFLEPLSSTMHEAGHGMYEQGLPKAARFGQPLGEAVSLGIHESQSRMWENFVGRSRAFWAWCLPLARRHFGEALAGVSEDDAYAAANRVQRSLIRVEADEATYNLHIMLRFGLERALLAGRLAVRDLPGEWNAAFKDMLGIDVPDDARGCLQDVHWSFGLVGYFPTYTLGNLYAAQLWEKINADLPDLNARVARGDFVSLRAWLNTNIHAHGRRYRAAELCQRATGKPLSAEPLMRHLEGKLKPLYGV